MNYSSVEPSDHRNDMPGFLQTFVFAVLQIIFLPFTIAGYVLLVSRITRYSKRYGLSATAIRPLGVRWILHNFGVRDDKVAASLVAALPHISMTALWMTMGPAFMANRLSGYLPRVARLTEPGKIKLGSSIGYRTAFIDEIIENNINSLQQVVLLGAGFDTRAFKYCKNNHISVFELDKPNTQKLKIETLVRAGIDYQWINFVPVDFNHESWISKLLEHGFDTDRKTLFIWEGVTLYLEKDSVIQTLKAMAASSGKGSIVAFDFYSDSFVAGQDSLVMKHYGQKMANSMGEGFRFGVDTAANPEEYIRILLLDAGLEMVAFELMGEKTDQVKPFGGLTMAVNNG